MPPGFREEFPGRSPILTDMGGEDSADDSARKAHETSGTSLALGVVHSGVK
jgi:hypothetical protein